MDTEEQWQAAYARALIRDGCDAELAVAFAAVVWLEIVADIEEFARSIIPKPEETP